jgi:hypothetical protein
VIVSALERPANSASKVDWMAYIESREDIKDKSDAKRDDLIARVDAANKALLDAQTDPVDPPEPDAPAGDVDDAPASDPDERDPVRPVHTYKVVNSDQGEPLRAAGHVLTEGYGWVPEVQFSPETADESSEDGDVDA